MIDWHAVPFHLETTGLENRGTKLRAEPRIWGIIWGRIRVKGDSAPFSLTSALSSLGSQTVHLQAWGIFKSSLIFLLAISGVPSSRALWWFFTPRASKNMAWLQGWLSSLACWGVWLQYIQVSKWVSMKVCLGLALFVMWPSNKLLWVVCIGIWDIFSQLPPPQHLEGPALAFSWQEVEAEGEEVDKPQLTRPLSPPSLISARGHLSVLPAPRREDLVRGKMERQVGATLQRTWRAGLRNLDSLL